MHLQYSTTNLILPTFSKEQANRVVDGYYNTSIDWVEDIIKELVTTTSIAPGIFKDGKRKLESVSDVQFIMLDFDSPQNQPASEVYLHLKNKYPNTAWCVFASNSNQAPYQKNNQLYKPHDKYRVLFPLEKPITKTQLAQLAEYFKEQYPLVDATCFGAYRYFYKGKSDIFYFNEGSSYLKLDVTPLPNKTNQDKIYLKETTEVRTKDEVVLTIKDITEKTIVYCPFHNDHNPSAVVQFTAKNIPFLYCSKCDADGRGTNQKGSFYLEPGSFIPHGTYLFYAENAQKNGALVCRVEPDELEPSYFTRHDDWENYCYINHLDPKDKIKLRRHKVIRDPGLLYGPQEPGNSFNLYRPSKYKKIYSEEEKFTDPDLEILRKGAPLIYFILTNIIPTTPEDNTQLQWYLNWLGVLLQTGQTPATGVILISRQQGAGKDLLFQKILAPIFGENNCAKENNKSFADKFNSTIAYKRLICYDEMTSQGSEVENAQNLQWIKTRIGSSTQVIEGKGQDRRQGPHFTGYTIHSNSPRPIVLEEGDRRFVVFSNPDVKEIRYTPVFINRQDQIEAVTVAEVPFFAEYLQRLKVSVAQASNALPTAAKQILIEVSKNEISEFSKALSRGDVGYFALEDCIVPGNDESSGKVTQMNVKRLIEDTRDFITKHKIPTVTARLIFNSKFPNMSIYKVHNLLRAHQIRKSNTRHVAPSGEQYYFWEYYSEELAKQDMERKKSGKHT